MRIALFASGNGSNVAAITEYFQKNEIQHDIVALVCDQPKAFVLERMKNIPEIATLCLAPKNCANRIEYEEKILGFLREHAVDYIVLAGYMRVVGETLLKAYPQKIMNIHPSLLPKHPGRHGIQDAYEAGDKETGVTIHWIDEGIDSGPIIIQERLGINKEWTMDELEDHIHAIEHRIYPKTIVEILDNNQQS